ncbi:MAG: 3-keto-5-aminohexanoate cleavage protein [Deltaproteobacteria bacterium]|nr:3-keto-5-aminohexanoate cleavage protein [Deltaproteobacteria bacterium]
MQKLIITVALTGNVPTKEMNPNVPVTPSEIAEDVNRCAAAGASVFHVHARDKDQKPTLDTSIFKEIAKNIKAKNPDVIIQLSTGARAGKDENDRIKPIDLLPEMGSFTTGSNNLPGIVYENSPSFIKKLGETFGKTGVKPEIEVFELGMINNAQFLVNKGILKEPLHFSFVLGATGSMPGTVQNLSFLTQSIPNGSTWSVAGIGKSEIPLATAAIAMGGHVRVGVEDNLFMPDGSQASNLTLVEKIVRIAKEVGRDIATPDEAREILSLKRENKDRILDLI